MRRKSAYILFLAVLGLLVIGIVMLFSTSAYARDSHGDVYFFSADELSFLAENMVALVRTRAGCSGALLHSAHRDAHQWIAPMGGLRSDYLSAIGTRKDRHNFFPCCLVCAT